MTALKPPRLETRRAGDFERELVDRARAWLPSWGSEDQGDFGRALLEIAARFSSEVAERLDRAGEKMHNGLLDWLGIRGKAARPARMPVVVKMAAKAPAPVLVRAPLRMQVDVGAASVVFESESDVNLMPGSLALVAATDADDDKLFMQPPGFTEIEPGDATPDQWTVKSFASPGSTALQLDPDSGLEPTMIVEIAGAQYKIETANKDLVTITPAVPAGGLSTGTLVKKVSTFEPFEPVSRNWQEHALYLGHTDLLNVEGAATIEVVGAQPLAEVDWHYWGKADGSDVVDWQRLTAKASTDGVVLSKGKGSVEQGPVGAVKSSRWIRASSAKVSSPSPGLRIDNLDLRINCKSARSCPPLDASDQMELKAEALANTTPLVLNGAFYPLGRAPKQFDTFYLGCDEAFSKKGAQVQLCFELADQTFRSLSALRAGAADDAALAGVGKDGALHLYRVDAANGQITRLLDRGALQPLQADAGGGTVASPPISLDRNPSWRLPTWSDDTAAFIGVSAGSSIWAWAENKTDPAKSGWKSLGQLPSADLIGGLVYLDDALSPLLVALQSGGLFVSSLQAGTQWSVVEPNDTGVPIKLAAIAPVLVDVGSGRLSSSANKGLVGIDDNGVLYAVSPNGDCVELTTTNPVAPGIAPVALTTGSTLTVIAVEQSLSVLVAVDDTGAEVTQPLLNNTDGVVGGTLEAALDGSDLMAIATVRRNGDAYVATWTPQPGGSVRDLFTADLSVGTARAGGAPTAVAGYLVVPGEHSDVFVSSFDLGQRLELIGDIGVGIVVPATLSTLAVNDLIVRELASQPKARTVTGVGQSQGGETFYPIDSVFPAGASGQVFAYDMSATLAGTFAAPNSLTLHPSDRDTEVGTWLWMDDTFFAVSSVSTSRVAKLNPNPPPTASGTYVRPIATGGRVAASLRLDPTNSNWKADLLGRVALRFPGETPEKQDGKAFVIGLDNHPSLIVLGEEFNPPASGPTAFLLDAAVGSWERYLGDSSANPELSWEYWNGAWSKLLVRDQTLQLKNSGAVLFDVPTDIATTDWAGKTHFWVRARLIGGDYGTEAVTVITEPLPNNKSKQTFERSTEGITPPAVVDLDISYAMCGGVPPIFVITEDSGTTRDQSDANRTPNAMVEAFVPLSVSLGRLLRDSKPAPAKEECPPDCGCPGEPAPTISDTGSATNPDPSLPVNLATGRSIFLGFDAELSGQTVNVLLMTAKERRSDAFAPLKVEALIGDRFRLLTVNDRTRALGENGLITLSLEEAPTKAELFGQSLRWLRLSPRDGAATGWSPSLSGAYLNGVWASSTETLTRELLGSSVGEPNLKLKVARPPVLQKSLELRVKEPLSDEERHALTDASPANVISNDPNLPGDWVLWERVTDPNDEDPGRRVYSLDEESGEIQFGDGLHGLIPPIGVDSIVAFQYQRTEPPAPGAIDVPANGVGARTKINLVTPVAGAESAFSAAQAAGGAPPEAIERVVRFGSARLRHRGCVVTAQDLEDLALESSPLVVQARAIIGRETHLVVVMRGDDPVPREAQKRELKRLLLTAAPPSLDPATLVIQGPRLRQLRIRLGLQTATLDDAAAVADDVRTALLALFDAGAGGRSKQGWPLGLSPGEEDIALALAGIQRLLSIESVGLSEVIAEGKEGLWRTTLAPNELVRLAVDGLRFDFEATGAVA